MTYGYEGDSQILAEIGRCFARAAPPKIEVRLPGSLARQAVAAWERDDKDSAQLPESEHERILRHHAGTLALIGLAITQAGRWDGDQMVVKLDPAFIGMAITAADDQPDAPGRARPPDNGNKSLGCVADQAEPMCRTSSEARQCGNCGAGPAGRTRQRAELGSEHSWRPAQRTASCPTTVAAVCCCRKIRNGRSRERNRPLTWVELRGFEPLTPSMRTRCATGLRYSPENLS